MALELTAGIDASEETIAVTGTVPAEIGSGYVFSLGDEILTLRTFGAVRRALTATYSINRNSWVCSRGQAGSTAVAHLAAVSVFGVSDAWVAGTGTGEPEPIVTSGGGGGAVDSVNGQTGVVVLDAGDLDTAAPIVEPDVQAALEALGARGLAETMAVSHDTGGSPIRQEVGTLQIKAADAAGALDLQAENTVNVQAQHGDLNLQADGTLAAEAVVVSISVDGDTGSAGDVLTADGAGAAGWAASPAAGAARWLGPYRLSKTSALVPAVAEVMTLAVDTPTPDGGTFFLGDAEIEWDATAAEIKAALDALYDTESGWSGYESVVTDGPLPATVTITMTPHPGSDGSDLPLAFADNSLTGGTYAVTEVTPYVLPRINGRDLFPVEVGDLLLRAESVVVEGFSNTDGIYFAIDLDPEEVDLSTWLGANAWQGELVEISLADDLTTAFTRRQVADAYRYSTEDTTGASALFKSRSARVLAAGMLQVFLGTDPTLFDTALGEMDIYVEVATPVLT